MTLEQIRKVLSEGRSVPFTGRGVESLVRPLSPDPLREVLDEIEASFNVEVVAFGVGPFVYGDLRRYRHQEFEIETHAVMIKQGLLGTLWGRCVMHGFGNLAGDEIVFVAEGRSWKVQVGNSLKCARCGGSGNIGMMSSVRCPEC